MKNHFRILFGIILLLLVISICFNIALAASDEKPEPGSEQDPLVSKSYVDTNVEKYELELQQLREEITALKENGQGAGSKGFEAVSVDAGRVLSTGSGSEIVLRTGKAVAVKGENGGLSDTTSAKDLTDGMAITYNHLLISSRDDGRGLKTLTKCWFIIRGAYKINELPAKETESVKEESIGNGIVNVPLLNIRAEPNTNSTKLAKLAKGENVVIISKSGEWYKVKTSQGVYGWSLGNYIALK